ncbi:A-kinase anchor protein 13-like [Elgaria multicarinata webbii]|uniref:A-kinase anchor protein 13-like n=1 Tax=Elgaria multicarinata webbii TaxID=159646 RepID=UPI002FCD6611
MEEEDGDDRFLRVQMRRPGVLRGSAQMYDCFRRHSWEPGKVLEEDPGFDQRSMSLKGLDPDAIDSSSTDQLDGLPLGRRDPRRDPIIHSNDEMESLLSQDEEDEEDDREVSREHSQRIRAYHASPSSVCSSLSKSVSMSGVDNYLDADEISLYSDVVELANG